LGLHEIAVSVPAGAGAEATTTTMSLADALARTGNTPEEIAFSEAAHQATIDAIDAAMSTVANQRANLGAFQANTLETSSNNLRSALEHATSAESGIRDTDFGSEIARFTQQQVMLQAGATVLGNANQIPSLIASLLRG